MKKLLFIFFILIFVSSASATRQAPLGNITIGAQSEEAATQPPPIAQTLIREGDFAIKLSKALKIGQAKNEAEAESTLASSGIAPKNGWIADYPREAEVLRPPIKGGAIAAVLAAEVPTFSFKATGPTFRHDHRRTLMGG